MNNSKCQKTKVFNPKTGRCVLKTGKIGRQILAGKPAQSQSSPRRSSCRKFRKTKDPKCNDQSGCKWVVGTGCIRSPSR